MASVSVAGIPMLCGSGREQDPLSFMDRKNVMAAVSDK